MILENATRAMLCNPEGHILNFRLVSLSWKRYFSKGIPHIVRTNGWPHSWKIHPICVILLTQQKEINSVWIDSQWWKIFVWSAYSVWCYYYWSANNESKEDIFDRYPAWCFAVLCCLSLTCRGQNLFLVALIGKNTPRTQTSERDQNESLIRKIVRNAISFSSRQSENLKRRCLGSKSLSVGTYNFKVETIWQWNPSVKLKTGWRSRKSDWMESIIWKQLK